jgi:hypothetical protein
MRSCRLPSLALLLATVAVSASADAPPPGGGRRTDAPADQGTIVVTLEDGTTVPLRNWTLSYEYGMAKPGVSPLFAPTARKSTTELYVGKKALPTAGQTLTVTYTESMRETETDTGITTQRIKTPRELTLAGADGRKTTFKVEPPVREMLVPSLEKGMTVMARTLDVMGETVTGTKKDFCILSYTAVVECGGTAADRVVKVDFRQ